jgi:hypothetical protein
VRGRLRDSSGPGQGPVVELFRPYVKEIKFV